MCYKLCSNLVIISDIIRETVTKQNIFLISYGKVNSLILYICLNYCYLLYETHKMCCCESLSRSLFTAEFQLLVPLIRSSLLFRIMYKFHSVFIISLNYCYYTFFLYDFACYKLYSYNL